MYYGKLGVELSHMRIGKAHFLVIAGTPGLYPYVGPADNLFKRLLASGRSYVQRYRKAVASILSLTVGAALGAGHVGGARPE